MPGKPKHKHSPTMMRCLENLEGKQGMEPGKAHRICYSSVKKALENYIRTNKK